MNRLPNSSAQSAKANLIELALLTLAYFCAARVGLYFAFHETNISPWWPPSGVALAAVMWRGSRVWPAIACGAFAANLTSFFGSHAPLSVAILLLVVVSVGNTLECLVGLNLLNRFKSSSEALAEREDHLGHPLGSVRFAALAAALSCTVPATIGALSVSYAGLGGSSDTAYLWWTWWTGDVVGVLIFTPAILAWKYRDGFALAGRRAEACLLCVSATVVSVWVFGVTPYVDHQLYPHAYLVMPFLMWAAFRFGRPGAGTALLWISSLAAWGTANGRGPFGVQNHNESLLLLQTFMGVVAMTTLVLSSALSAQRAAQETLESRIEERTTELVQSHVQVADSLARLQDSETLRDNLMHMIVHDLRMPLNALNYALRAMTATGELSPHQQGAMDISKQSAQTLSLMIGNLLDIHQIEAGVLVLKRQSIAPSALVEKALSQIEFVARYKGLNLKSEVEPGLPAVEVDEEKVGRVLTNLLDNAIRLTSQGGTVALKVSTLKETPDSIAFSVADTGSGIPAEAFGRIFEKFGRANPSHTEEKATSGLGLTFCKMIVQAHGGEIWVESELKRGSTFFFSIPVE